MLKQLALGDLTAGAAGTTRTRPAAAIRLLGTSSLLWELRGHGILQSDLTCSKKRESITLRCKSKHISEWLIKRKEGRLKLESKNCNTDVINICAKCSSSLTLTFSRTGFLFSLASFKRRDRNKLINKATEKQRTLPRERNTFCLKSFPYFSFPPQMSFDTDLFPFSCLLF